MCEQAGGPLFWRPLPGAAAYGELLQKRTELYELLLYAQKKYRETGEQRFLQDAKKLQTEIADCGKALRSLKPEA